MSINERVELGVFFHMLYELNKGLRNLSLFTAPKKNINAIIEQLTKCNYEFIVEELKSDYANIFFGSRESVAVIRAFNKKSLKDFSPEEDFILGVLLGYNKEQQCKRFLSIKGREVI
ncbi:MAG: DUF2023 family protein [Fusobacteriaceae bacterium]|jgi:hypothetical protein|nr:DUF2023 family protein [Fusobacteriaceae bacterium]